MLLTALLFLAAAVLVLILPGAALLAWLNPSGQDPADRLAETIGLSIAVTCLVGLVFFYLGVRLSPVAFVSLYALALIVWVTGKLRQANPFTIDGKALVVIAIFLAAVAWRLYQARDLVFPAWVDSVHHTLIVRWITEFGGVPPDFGPYLPSPFYYYFGFHLVTAAFTAWSHLDPAQAVLTFGQLINAAVGLSVYRLGKAAWGDWRRAGAAALLVTFTFHMPAYYLTWGRYTLLTGLILLPLAMAAALEVRRSPRNYPAILRLALFTAGICVSHYLIVGLLGLFLAVMAIAEAIPAIRRRDWRSFTYQPLSGAALGALVATPWLLRAWNYTYSQAGISLVTPFDSVDPKTMLDYPQYLIYLLGPYRDYVVMVLAAIGTIFAIRKSQARLMIAWTGLVFLLALPWGIRINPFRPDHLVIMLFLPAAFFLGDLLISGGEAIVKLGKPRLATGAAGLALGGLLVWGLVETPNILNSATIFTTQGDRLALQWINQNTPADARFMINTTMWQGTLYRGVDGGYWIPTETGRTTQLPVVFYSQAAPEYTAMIRDRAERTSKLTTCTPAFFSLVKEADLGYVYLREGVGSLQPKALEACKNALTIVYQKSGVTIYQIRK